MEVNLKTKFNIGDEVWLEHWGELISSKILGVRVVSTDGLFYGFKYERQKTTIAYTIMLGGIDLAKSENELFSTREELINTLGKV